MNIYLNKINDLLNNNISLEAEVALLELLDLYIQNEKKKVGLTSLFIKKKRHFVKEITHLKAALIHALTHKTENQTVDSFIIEAFNSLNITVIAANDDIGDLCRAFLTFYQEFIHLLNPKIVLHFSAFPYLNSASDVFEKLIADLKPHPNSLVFEALNQFVNSVDIEREISEEKRKNAICKIIEFWYQDQSHDRNNQIPLLNTLLMASSKESIPDMIDALIKYPIVEVIELFVAKGIFKQNFDASIGMCLVLLTYRDVPLSLLGIKLLKNNLDKIPDNLINTLCNKLLINFDKFKQAPIHRKDNALNKAASELLFTIAMRNSGAFNQDLIDKLIALVSDSKFAEAAIHTLILFKFIPMHAEHPDLILALVHYIADRENVDLQNAAAKLLNNTDISKIKMADKLIWPLIDLVKTNLFDKVYIRELIIKLACSPHATGKEDLIDRMFAILSIANKIQIVNNISISKLVMQLAFIPNAQSIDTARIRNKIWSSGDYNLPQGFVALSEYVLTFDDNAKKQFIDEIISFIDASPSYDFCLLLSQIAITLPYDSDYEHIGKIINKLWRSLRAGHMEFLANSVNSLFDSTQKITLLGLLINEIEKQNYIITLREFGLLTQLAANADKDVELEFIKRLALWTGYYAPEHNFNNLGEVISAESIIALFTTINYSSDPLFCLAAYKLFAYRIVSLVDPKNIINVFATKMTSNMRGAHDACGILVELVLSNSLNDIESQAIVNNFMDALKDNMAKLIIINSINRIMTACPKYFTEMMIDKMVLLVNGYDRHYDIAVMKLFFPECLVNEKIKSSVIPLEKKQELITKFINFISQNEELSFTECELLEKISASYPLSIKQMEALIANLLPTLTTMNLKQKLINKLSSIATVSYELLREKAYQESFDEKTVDQLILLTADANKSVSLLIESLNIRLSSTSSKILLTRELDLLDQPGLPGRELLQRSSCLGRFKFTLETDLYNRFVDKLVSLFGSGNLIFRGNITNIFINLSLDPDQKLTNYLINKIHAEVINRANLLNSKREEALSYLEAIATHNPDKLQPIIDENFILLLQTARDVPKIKSTVTRILEIVGPGMAKHLKHLVLKIAMLEVYRERDPNARSENLFDLARHIFTVYEQAELKREYSLGYFQKRNTKDDVKYQLLNPLLHFSRHFYIERVLKARSEAFHNNGILNMVKAYLPYEPKRLEP